MGFSGTPRYVARCGNRYGPGRDPIDFMADTGSKEPQEMNTVILIVLFCLLVGTVEAALSSGSNVAVTILETEKSTS